MRGFLLRLAVGFLTLIIGLGVAAIFGTRLMPNFTRNRSYNYRVVTPRVEVDDDFYRGMNRGCPHHQEAQIIQPRLDVSPQIETAKPVKPIPAQPRARY
ncbi:MAG: hypothetical protein NVSMB56_08140 [Pyrinomonadaceae bacterium]